VAFTSLLQPPPDHAGPTVWVLLRGGAVWIGEAPPGAPPAPVAPGAQFLGLFGEEAWWVGEVAEDVELELELPFLHLRERWAELGDERWAMAGRGVQLLEWARTHRFCGRCGTPTEPAPGERALRCPACGLTAFARIAPVVIMLVVRGDECVLARGVNFPGRTFSCVAGFVEPGETLEDAVRREVMEEVGLRLGAVRYRESQPWPFPHSLMCGFEAEWAGGEIVCQESEIAEAAWFRWDELPDVPGRIAIARRLIDAWVAERQAAATTAAGARP
jgi:NAD+ diphosphatase